MTAVAVIGTGTWGTALATVAARKGPTALWGRRHELVQELMETRRHPRLPVPVHEEVRPTADGKDLADAELIYWAVPTQHTRSTSRQLVECISPDAVVVSLSKGLEEETQKRVTEILAEELPGRDHAVLSGPGHAEEVVQGKPTALVVAGDQRARDAVVQHLHYPSLRVYTGTDLVGVELGGALKNVIAIAAGVIDGLELGDNIKATLVTRGLAEMRRLGRAMGAQDATFAGLAGVGDLLTTCYSPFGRNRALGLALGRGETAASVLESGTIAEGAWTSLATVALSERFAVEMPIANQVASSIWHDKPVAQAIEELLARASREEEL